MNKYIIPLTTETRLVRINKRLARKLFNHNLPVIFCPVNFNPCNMYAPGQYYRKSTENDFTKLVNSFEYYNCSLPETGYYTAFYVPYCMIDKTTGNRRPWDYSAYNYNITYDTEYINTMEG